MDLELVSYNVCPYVQRSVITLNHKDEKDMHQQITDAVERLQRVETV